LQPRIITITDSGHRPIPGIDHSLRKRARRCRKSPQPIGKRPFAAGSRLELPSFSRLKALAHKLGDNGLGGKLPAYVLARFDEAGLSNPFPQAEVPCQSFHDDLPAAGGGAGVVLKNPVDAGAFFEKDGGTIKTTVKVI
jgi:hypothetical protein